MKGFVTVIIIVCSFLTLGMTARAEEMSDVSDALALVEQIDQLYRSNTSYAELEMRIETPDWNRTMNVMVWTEGMKKTFIRILSPQKDRGVATLRNDKEMWNYFPKIDKVMKVPPSMMMSSWMGSDFTNDDLVRESSLVEDYTARFLPSEDDSMHTIELIPKRETATVWGKLILLVTKADKIPVRYEYYDEKGTRMRTMEFKEIKELGGRKLPTVMELIPLNKQGNRTVITYLDAQFDLKLDSDTFSLRNLQKRI